MGADATQLERGREDTRRADAIGTSARGQPVRSTITEPQLCTQLVHTLMEETLCRQEVLAHAMAAQQREGYHGQASHHSTDDEPNPAPVSTVQAEYAACESVQKE